MGVERRLVRWLTFLTVRSKERMAELVKGDAVMEKAVRMAGSCLYGIMRCDV